MEPTTQQIPIILPNGQRLLAEATAVEAESGLESIPFPVAKFDGVIGAIEGIGTAIGAAIDKVKPSKASVEMGLELALESGQLTALLVKGSGKANLKITLHWG